MLQQNKKKWQQKTVNWVDFQFSLRNIIYRKSRFGLMHRIKISTTDYLNSAGPTLICWIILWFLHYWAMSTLCQLASLIIHWFCNTLLCTMSTVIMSL